MGVHDGHREVAVVEVGRDVDDQRAEPVQLDMRGAVEGIVARQHGLGGWAGEVRQDHPRGQRRDAAAADRSGRGPLSHRRPCGGGGRLPAEDEVRPLPDELHAGAQQQVGPGGQRPEPVGPGLPYQVGRQGRVELRERPHPHPSFRAAGDGTGGGACTFRAPAARLALDSLCGPPASGWRAQEQASPADQVTGRPLHGVISPWDGAKPSRRRRPGPRRVQTPSTASSRPERIALMKSSKSRSFWSA